MISSTFFVCSSNVFSTSHWNLNRLKFSYFFASSSVTVPALRLWICLADFRFQYQNQKEPLIRLFIVKKRQLCCDSVTELYKKILAWKDFSFGRSLHGRTVERLVCENHRMEVFCTPFLCVSFMQFLFWLAFPSLLNALYWLYSTLFAFFSLSIWFVFFFHLFFFNFNCIVQLISHLSSSTHTLNAAAPTNFLTYNFPVFI